MSFLPEPVGVTFDEAKMTVALDDGRAITIPLSWYPSLHRATPEQRAEVWLSPGGLHWDALDEDISVEGLLGIRHERDSRRHAA